MAGEWSFLTEPTGRSPYYPEVLQGATLVPRSLWFVELPANKPVNVKAPFVRTAKFATAGAKEPWNGIKLEGRVERQFLFATVVAEDLLPFAVRQLRLVVLPLAVRDDRFVMLDSDEVLGEGAELASDWVKRSERIWEKRKKKEQPSIYEYLNYDQKITNQTPQAEFVVLYNRSGTNIVAAFVGRSELAEVAKVQPQGFVADFATYRYYPDSEDHALYLTGILNSEIVNELIKPWQTQGLQGERDITRRPFEVCAIPKFAQEISDHQQIVTAARGARAKMLEWRSKIEGNAGQARAAARRIIRPEMELLDEAVARILRDQLKPAKSGRRRDTFTESLFPKRGE